MSIKPVLSFRGLTLVTFVLSLLGIATFAFGERIFPTVLTEIFYASAAGQDSSERMTGSFSGLGIEVGGM